MVVTQVAKEMRRYLKLDEVEARRVQIEDIKETMVNDIEGPRDDEDSSAKARGCFIPTLGIKCTQPDS